MKYLFILFLAGCSINSSQGMLDESNHKLKERVYSTSKCCKPGVFNLSCECWGVKTTILKECVGHCSFQEKQVIDDCHEVCN